MNAFWKMRSVCGGMMLVAMMTSSVAGADLAELTNRVMTAMGTYQTARREYEQLAGNLVSERQIALKAAKNSASYQQAVQDVALAHQRFKEAEAEAASDVRSHSSRYQELEKQLQTVTSQIALARTDKTTSIETYTRLYEKKASLGADMRAIEAQAAQAANVVLLKAKWNEASEALNAKDAEIGKQVESAPAVVTAKEKADEARKRVEEAGTQWTAAQTAYQQANWQQAQDAYFRARMLQAMEQQYQNSAAAAAWLVLPGSPAFVGGPQGPVVVPK